MFFFFGVWRLEMRRPGAHRPTRRKCFYLYRCISNVSDVFFCGAHACRCMRVQIHTLMHIQINTH